MTIEKVRDYLQKELPEFSYTLGTETPHEENWSSIKIERDGNEVMVDVSKIDNQRALENLKAWILAMWKKVEVDKS